MILAVLFQNSQGEFTGYSAKGHSGYARAGHDIVCAAVSILGCSCVNSLESVCGKEPVLTENDDGALAFHLPLLDPQAYHDAQVLMQYLYQGLAALAETYPKHVNLTISKGG